MKKVYKYQLTEHEFNNLDGIDKVYYKRMIKPNGKIFYQLKQI